MKLLILYKPNSEHARVVEDYVDDLTRQHSGLDMQLIDAESIEGIAKSQLYDILEFPALLVVDSNGIMINQWKGETLPLQQELLAYLHV